MWDTPHMAIFGFEMRRLRQTAGETIGQTAAALGIDRTHLTKIELGQDHPSERVVQALFRHFSVNAGTASKLWDMAGFRGAFVVAEHFNSEGERVMKDTPAGIPNASTSISVDPSKPAYYTDSIYLNSTDYGLVISFGRRVGPEQHVVDTSVGMSFDHAKKLVEVLNDHLNKHER